MKSEDLRRIPGVAIGHVCDFLEIEGLPDVKQKNVHSRSYEAPMSEQERDYLRSIFEPEIKELESELSWDCSEWLSE